MKYLFSLLVLGLFFALFSCSDETNNIDTKPVACITIDDCSNGSSCVDGFCKKEVEDNQCIDNADCPSGYKCDDNSGECIEITCEFKDDCSRGFICKDTKCIKGCESSSDCESGEKCENESCIEDNHESDCRLNPEVCEQGYVCDESSIDGNCKLNTSCVTNADCSSDSECIEGNCLLRPTCSSNDECQEPDICREDGFCGPDNGCTSDNYCMNEDPIKPACNFNSGICYECVTDEHCSEGEECNTTTNLCGEPGSNLCVADSDCGLNRKCEEDGTCVSMFGAECTSDADCTDLNKGKCLTEAEPKRCVQCLQDDQCEQCAPEDTECQDQICNANTYLCENQGSGANCETDSDCNVLAGETCVNEACYNPNSSGNDGAAGLCDADLGGTMCILFGGSCNGDILTNPNCSLDPIDIWCGDCVFE